ncbi:MAG: hypothetical protein ABH863_00695 [Candidatus Micrarchaeota archaeon]
MKIKPIITAMLAIILVVTSTISAASIQLKLDTSPIYQLTSPQAIDQQFHSVDEGQTLSFTETFGAFNGHTYGITTDRYVLFGNPIWISQEDISSSIPGAIMNWDYKIAQPAVSTFTWTPTFCQARPMDYSFRVLRYMDVNPYTNPNSSTHSNLTNITVNNINRNPNINTYLAPTYYIALGNSKAFPISATDPDYVECNETTYINMSHSFTFALSAPSANFVQSESGQATVTISTTQNTLPGTYTLFVYANDGQGETMKSTNIVVYQPTYSSRPTCIYDKRTRTYRCM